MCRTGAEICIYDGYINIIPRTELRQPFCIGDHWIHWFTDKPLTTSLYVHCGELLPTLVLMICSVPTSVEWWCNTSSHFSIDDL